MTGTHARFTGSIPENYDRYLGPFLFEPYAQDLVRRLDAKEGARVLEIACGTGIVTRRLREHLPPASALVATDLNPPMLELARRKLGAVKGIDWRQADACALPFPDASFDAAVCQFGLMFVPDKPAACREARRVLVKGGTFLLSTWGALAQNPVGRIAYETVASFFPADPPDFYTVPFGLHQPEVVRGFLAAGGFTAVSCDEVTLEGRVPSARDLAIGLIEGNPVGTAIRERGGVPVEKVIEAVAAAVAKECGDRPVRAPMRALVFAARAGAA